jgi:hypothetical protein
MPRETGSSNSSSSSSEMQAPSPAGLQSHGAVTEAAAEVEAGAAAAAGGAGQEMRSCDEVETLAAALQALHFLCLGHQENTARLASAGGLELVLKGKQ